MRLYLGRTWQSWLLVYILDWSIYGVVGWFTHLHGLVGHLVWIAGWIAAMIGVDYDFKFTESIHEDRP
jgi:hypothetical protein